MTMDSDLEAKEGVAGGAGWPHTHSPWASSPWERADVWWESHQSTVPVTPAPVRHPRAYLNLNLTRLLLLWLQLYFRTYLFP